MNQVKCIILGGGQGKRLFPLTRERSKPAVPIGGKYRLIDITLSNSINSHVHDIFILTQFNSKSLNNHISRTYKFDYFSEMSVQLLAAEQTLENRDWFQGTADAVRKHWVHYRLEPTDDVVVLAGDHLYQMDYRDIVKAHRESKADVTVSCTLVPPSETKGLGLVKVNSSKRITNFVEKTKDPKILKQFALSHTAIQSMGIHGAKAPAFLGSMGVYVFRASVLAKLLNGKETDFGREIIPKALFSCKAYAYFFDGFWRDIGTIGSFYEVNIGLAKGNIAFDFFSKKGKFYTHPRFLPPLKIQSAQIRQSLISEGCIFNGAVISQSVIGLRSMIGEGTRVERSYLMGADFYEKTKKKSQEVPIGVGKNCTIKHAIIDKNVRIGDNVKIINRKNIREADGPHFCIRDGIVIIPKGATVPSGTVI